MSVCTERIKMTWMQRLGKLSASMYSSKVQNDLKGGGDAGLRGRIFGAKLIYL